MAAKQKGIRLTHRLFNENRNGWFSGQFDDSGEIWTPDKYDRVNIDGEIENASWGRGGFANLFFGLHMTLKSAQSRYSFYLGNYDDIGILRGKTNVKKLADLEGTGINLYKYGWYPVGFTLID